MQTNPILPTTVIPNSTPGIDWLTPNNILLADGDFAVSGGDTQILTVGNFQVNLSQGDTVTNIVFAVKGYRGSFDTTLQIFAVDDTSGTPVEYELLPSFQGFDGDNTLYTLDPSLFGTTWSVNKINNIKIKLIANGELHLDYVTLNVIYTPEATETLTYDTLTGTFDVGDTILGGDSGATALIVTDNGASSMTITSIDGVFIVGETITGTPSGATAVVTDPFTTGEIVVDEFVQAQPFQLAQSMTSTAISCLVQSFNYSDGRPIAYADFYGNALIVVDQGTPSEENIRITDVQQNYNGTGYTRLDFGSLSNRGLEFKYPYTTNADLRFDHSGTAEVVISNSAPFYDRFLKKAQIGALVSAPITVQDEGIEITDYVTLFDFQGAGVTVDETFTGHVRVTIPGVTTGQAGIQFKDEGSNLGTSGTATSVDFVGSGVTATRVSNAITVTIPGGGGGSGTVTNVSSSDGLIDITSPTTTPVLTLDTVSLGNDTTFINTLTTNSTFQTNVNSFVGGGAGYYGNGSDGAVTISSPTTLTRDMYYTNLTVNDTLTTNGWRIFVNGTLSGNGTIKYPDGNAGTAGSSGTGGTGGAGGTAFTSGMFRNVAGAAGGNGGTSGTGTGSNGTATTTQKSYGPIATSLSGGNGGSIGAPSGGTGSAGSSTQLLGGRIYSSEGLIAGVDYDYVNTTFNRVVGGAQAGGGGGGATSVGLNVTTGGGGGGGASGGIVFIMANIVSGTFTIRAVGGAGGAGSATPFATGGAGGGGAGGNGGVAILIYGTSTWSGSYVLTGGTGGAGGLGNGGSPSGPYDGTAGANGATGTSIQIQYSVVL